jgi:7-cyano-7-deazaguanine synthase
MGERVVVLLSGGLDSTTCAYLARAAGHEIHALSFDYGQRLVKELESARRVAEAVQARQHVVMSFNLGTWGGSSLTDHSLTVPTHDRVEDIDGGIPSTYVPGRNTLFLSFALSFAEALDAQAIYIGVNALDYSGYPDCRPEYMNAFRDVARLGTRQGIEGRPVDIRAPLLNWNKAEIIRQGLAVGADYGLTWSCYQGGATPCGVCDSCLLRARGFEEAGAHDPLVMPAEV